MSVIAEDDIIDQTDYEEFAGVTKPLSFEEETEETEDVSLPAQPDISPNWQLDAEHTFVQEHFCKVTSCEYCGKLIVSLRWHQGLRCKECSFDCHYDCAPVAPKNCLSLHDEAPLRPDILQPHAFIEKHFGSHTFCNVCRKMLYGVGKQGFACSTCQFVSHEECLPKAPINCPPQKLDAPLSDLLRHYWVEGNLSGHCRLCRQSLSKFTILYGFRCSYCALKVCPACFHQNQHESCDEGPMASMKLGPGNVITHATDIQKKWTITVPEDRRPMIVFINKKSGGQVGQLIAQRLSRVVNPNQIVDLSQGGPMPMLKIMQKTKAPYRILACGGDGTVAWILSALDKMLERGATYVPPVAVLPLGTGNDLARVLGWGGGYDNEGLNPICRKIMLGHEVYLDRWRLDIENVDLDDGIKAPKIMNNYFSIGLDAKIALDFHRKREANPSKFKSRTMNKMIYAGLGATTMFESVQNLRQVLRVELDGQPLVLPKDLVGIIAINLASYAGGNNPWGSPSRGEGRAPQSPCDGLFEVIGITTPFHLGTMSASLADGTRLGQGRDITFTWTAAVTLPLQLDGEPWEEPQSVIRLSFFRQSRLIASPSEHEHWSKSQWLEPLPFTDPIKRKSKKSSSPSASSSLSTAASSSNSAANDPSPLIIEFESSKTASNGKNGRKNKKQKDTLLLASKTSDSTTSAEDALESTIHRDLIDFEDVNQRSTQSPEPADLLILNEQEDVPPRRSRKNRTETAPNTSQIAPSLAEDEPLPIEIQTSSIDFGSATELVALDTAI
jgi:diacylglycerol kinase (ATP)